MMPDDLVKMIDGYINRAYQSGAYNQLILEIKDLNGELRPVRIVIMPDFRVPQKRPKIEIAKPIVDLEKLT